jgi:hypothetical protein
MALATSLHIISIFIYIVVTVTNIAPSLLVVPLIYMGEVLSSIPRFEILFFIYFFLYYITQKQLFQKINTVLKTSLNLFTFDHYKIS